MSVYNSANNLCLGIDVGTTKIAVVLVDPKTREILDSASLATKADLVVAPGHSEQDVNKIFETIDSCILKLDPKLRLRASAIGVSGQMHGVMLWAPALGQYSNLVTWQDKRISSDNSLDQICKLSGSSSLKDGFGNATLGWFALHKPEVFETFDTASTIHDFVVAKLCGLISSCIDPTNAASWGLFNLASNTWEEAGISAMGVPLQCLPKVVPSGTSIGLVSSYYVERWGIPISTTVVAAMGDNQAALLGSLDDYDNQIAITIGTSAQLSVIIPPGNFGDFARIIDPQPYEIRPFFMGRQAIVAASLAGGNIFGFLNAFFQELVQGLDLRHQDGFALKDDVLANFLQERGQEKKHSTLKVNPCLLGERFDSGIRGSISNLGTSNCSIGDVVASTARGLVQNLKAMLPPSLLEGRRELIGSGGVIHKSVLMQELISEEFGLPLRLCTDSRGRAIEEAALGAALVAGSAMESA